MTRRLTAFSAPILALAFVLAVAPALFSPSETVERRVVAAIKAGTGRDLVIKGAKTVSLFSQRARFESVLLLDPGSANRPAVFAAKAIEGEARLWPLLRGRVELTRLSIEGPEIVLDVDAAGASNWALSAGNSDAPPLVEKLEIKDGAFAFSDARKQQKVMLTALNAVVTPGTPTPAANAVFDAVWTGEKIEGKAAVEAPSDLLAGRESKVTIDATTKHGKLTADGKLLLGDAPRFDGSASGATPSLRELCRWAGIQDCKDDEIGAVSVDGKLRADPQTIALASGTFKLESSTGEADVTYSKAGPRPSVTGKIKADKLDAKRHLGFDFSTAPTSAAATPAEPFSFRNAHESLKQSLAAFIAQAAEAPNAALAAARATASQPPPAAPPLDFAALKTMDIDLEMSIGALKVREFDVGVGKVMTTLKDGHLKLDGKDIALEGGRGSVRLELDTRPAAPALVLATDMKDIEARRLVTAITGQQAVTGKSTLIASIQGAGKSERELVTSLKGTVDARVNKGQIIGYDLARAISEFWATHDFDARARTPFEKVTAGFVLEKGIAKSSLIDFESPAVNFRASGLANLINRVLDYRLYLTLPSPPGFSIPVRAQGPWSKPNVSFDWEALFPRAVQPVAAAASAGPPSLGDPETDTLLAQAVSKSGQSGALAPEAIDMLKAISAPRR